MRVSGTWKWAHTAGTKGSLRNRLIAGTVFGACLLLAAFTALGCGSAASPIPSFKDEPPVLKLDKLLADYASDPETAAQKYEGNTYLFPSIYVDEVLSTFSDPEKYQLGAELYLASGPVKFTPKYIYDLDPIGPEFVVDILGQVSGWIQSTFYIGDCQYIIVEGGDLPPPGAY